MNHRIKLVIAPRGTGKSEFILTEIGESQELLVVSQAARPEDYGERLSEKRLPHQKRNIISEEVLADELTKKTYNHVHFTDLFAFVENTARHLDLFCSIAEFTVASSAQVWGEISLGSTEVENCRDAVRALVGFAPSTEVSEVKLREGSGLLLSIDPHALLRSATSMSSAN